VNVMPVSSISFRFVSGESTLIAAGLMPAA
jgi:hypothetical protein